MDEAEVVRSALPRISDTAWIISGPRLVQIQDASIEDVVIYLEIDAVKYLY